MIMVLTFLALLLQPKENEVVTRIKCSRINNTINYNFFNAMRNYYENLNDTTLD